MRTLRTVTGLALVWSGVVLWRERRRRRSRELLLVVRGAAAARPAIASGPDSATVDDGWLELLPGPTDTHANELSDTAADAGTATDAEVAVDAIGAVDEVLVLLARAEIPRPAVTLRLRWREATNAGGDAPSPTEETTGAA